jgi:hypothetical protein
MDVRIYRERPASMRHPKPVALALWDFLARPPGAKESPADS